jgi:hypothetical protein
MMDERLEALTRNLELLSLETENPDKQIAQLSPPSDGSCWGRGETAAVVEMPEPRLDSHDHRLEA